MPGVSSLLGAEWPRGGPEVLARGANPGSPRASLRTAARHRVSSQGPCVLQPWRLGLDLGPEPGTRPWGGFYGAAGGETPVLALFAGSTRVTASLT